MVAVVTSQTVGEFGGGAVNAFVDADAAEAAVVAADVVDDEVGFGTSGCPHSAEPVPAESAEPVERAAIGRVERVELVAV